MRNILGCLFLVLLMGTKGIGAEQIFYGGYNTIKIDAGYTAIGNNFIGNSADTHLTALRYTIPNPPLGAMFYRLSPDYLWQISTFDDLSEPYQWIPDNIHFNWTDGVYLFSSVETNIVMAGKIHSGLINKIIDNSVVGKFKFISTPFPKSGKITTDLGFNANSGDLIYKAVHFNGQLVFNVYRKDPTGWVPEEPTIEVGKGFFYYNATSTANINWSYTLFDNANDERRYEVLSLGFYDDFVGGFPINVACEQRSGESLYIEYSSDGVSWREFAASGKQPPQNPPQFWGTWWYARSGWENGFIRFRIVTENEIIPLALNVDNVAGLANSTIFTVLRASTSRTNEVIYDIEAGPSSAAIIKLNNQSSMLVLPTSAPYTNSITISASCGGEVAFATFSIACSPWGNENILQVPPVGPLEINPIPFGLWTVYYSDDNGTNWTSLGVVTGGIYFSDSVANRLYKFVGDPSIPQPPR
jgi:hypothetical protein